MRASYFVSPSESNDQNKMVKRYQETKGIPRGASLYCTQGLLGVEGKNLDTIAGKRLTRAPKSTQRVIGAAIRTVGAIALSPAGIASGAKLLSLFVQFVANGFVRFHYLFRVPIQPLQVTQELGVFRAVRLSFFRACGRESILFIRKMNPVTHGF